jgi:hypothetical protein
VTAHERTMPSAQKLHSKGDRTRPTDRDAYMRRRLPDHFPVGWLYCPDALERLYDDWLDDRDGRRPHVQYGLRAAAEEVLAFVQRELERKRIGPTTKKPGSVICELACERTRALDALRYCTPSYKAAKEIELRITDGEPLAICTGTWNLVTIRTVAGTKVLPLSGCYRVFPDSKTLGGHMWRHWCDDCDPKRGQPVRALRRLHAQNVALAAQRAA